MYRRISSIILFLLFHTIGTLAQQINKRPPVSRLLYYVDDSRYEAFLIPFIETYLKDLSLKYKDPQPVFSEVISLNRLFENRKIEGKIIDAFIYADRKTTSLQNSRERDRRDATIANSLLNYDRFLIIKISAFRELLEYQFLMFDVIKNKTPGVKDMPVLESYRSSSTFLNPIAPTAKEELAFTIKQVCPEVNESPEARISINSKIPSSLFDTVFIKVKDTLKISGLVIDPDSPNERFTYTWRVSDEMLYGQLSHGKATQKIVLDTPTVFNIALTVGDGITLSPKTTVTVKVIDQPTIEMGSSSNVAFLNDLPDDIFSTDLSKIRDDIQHDDYYTSEYLFIKNIWGRSFILNGEDSLTLYYSKGNIRVKNSNAPDSIIETTFKTDKLQRGNCALFRFYPRRELHTSNNYYYTFYADDHAVKSRNLNLKVSFIKIRQVTLFNEYAYSWLGSRKGSMGNVMLGIGWRPFGFLRINIAASRLFAASRHVTAKESDRINIEKINQRLILEFLNPNKLHMNCFSVLMQQYHIDTEKGTRTDHIWGIGLRSAGMLTTLGSRLDIMSGLHYFPNLNKRTYLSDAGIFEFTLGFRLFFYQGK
jgi:hypothetical protein